MSDKNKIFNILDSLHTLTALGSLCIDRSLNIIAVYPADQNLDDFKHMGINQTFGFIEAEILKDTFEPDVFYTYCLENSLVCNICFLYKHKKIAGAIVTQPVLTTKLHQDMTDALLTKSDAAIDYSNDLISMFRRIPVLSHTKLLAIGEHLVGQVKTIFTSDVRQVLRGGSDDFLCRKSFNSIVQNKSQYYDEAMKRHGSESTYLSIKDSIQRGDKEALLNTVSQINPGQVPMDQLDQSCYIRSLKNSLIKVCAMSCYAAIDANAPYYKMMDTADEYIRRIEQIDNINEIYELMKSAMLTFTRAVAVNRITSFSKPVRLVIEYIETHYGEKITLEILAGYVGLSTYYLSNLIKKETGQSLLDNINRIRIEEGKRLLLSSNMDINTVSALVGYKHGNHFASVFRKSTGLSPTEFRNSIKTEKDDLAEMLNLLFHQLYESLSFLPGVFDVARLVDPLKNTAWIVQTNNELTSGTCYEFWGRNETCKNCISYMAYTHHRPFIKIEEQGNHKYLVIAAPKKIGNNTFVVELLKRLDDTIVGTVP